jgi:hypothetical protein
VSAILKQTLGVSLGLGVVSAGAWFLCLRTLCTDLATLRAQATLQHVAMAEAPDLGHDHAAVISDFEARIARSHAIIDATPTIDRLYDALQHAGKEAGVRIEKLEPSSNGRKPVNLNAKAGFDAEAMTFDIEASGDFDQMVLFIARLERDFGLSKVSNVRVQPMPGQQEHGKKVIAQIATAHYVATPAVPPVKAGSGTPASSRAKETR